MANTCESPGAPLELDKPIFKDVKFYVSGQVHEKALDLLKSGGAERMNYFSDYVTHLICGPDCEETDLCDATEIYEIPALVEKWIYLSAKLKCLVNTKPFIYDPNKLFSGLTFAFSKVGQDRNALWSLITYNGGVVLLNFTDRATHLVTPYADGEKYAKASERPDRVVVVSPDWIVESVKSKTLLQTTLYHPKLILYPKRPDTTAITGFEPEAPAEADDGTATDSTQALLDKLKQRMPWNQPAEPPPNVVAPSFAGGQKPPEQQRIFAPSAGQQQQQFGPRGVVHHTPPYSQMNSPNFNRILEQIQRPNVPGVNRLGQQQQQFLQQQQKQNVLLQQRQMAPAAARQIFQQQQPQMVRQMVGNPMLQQQQNQQKMQQLLQQNQQRLVLGPQQQQQQQNMLMQQKQQQQMLQNVEQQQQVVQQNLMQQQQQHPKSQAQQQIPPNQIVQQQMGQVAPQQQPPQQVQQQLVQNQGLNQLIGQQQQQQQQQQMGLNQQQLMHQQQQGMISQASLLSPQQQQQHIVTSIPQQHMITSIQQQQQQLVQSQPQQTMVSMQQQQQQQQLLVQQQQQTIMPQMQFGKQFGQQIVTSNPQQNQQFVSSGPPTPFLQSQSGFAPQQQQQQQQQQPQPQQPGQFLQQTGQAPNLQIINQQQIVNQQMQKQPPHMMQQQQQPQQFQPGAQRPAIWQQQINVRHPNGVNVVQQQPQGPRVQWVGAGQQPQPVQRQYIHLDAQTHQQLQQMAPEERALFVQKIQKQRLLMQRQQIQLQQQRSGHILIRSSGPVPPGMNTQQHMQWLQQQAKQQGLVLQQQQQQQQQQQPQQPQQPPPAQSVPPPQHPAAPGLSPIQQPQQQPFADQNLQLQRQQLRLQQLQMQREQAQKNLQQQQQQQQPQQVAPLQARPQPAVDPTGVPPAVLDANQQTPLVNAKTKTALANMLSIRLQSGGSAMGPGSEAIAEPSAAGTLRLMTAQHNASLNPNGRAQEILALQQQRRAAIGGGAPTPTDIIRPPGPPSAAAVVPVVPQSPQNEPPKLQYSPRSVLPIQHRPGTFYGHNPNLKLPPDLFLLGCIFVVVELERFLDESMPGWQRKIEKHGGEIEKQYCSRVTHVLCETQRHGVVMQALRDYKRCVTLYWLSDVLKRKQVLPPWTALHLPTVYLDTVPAAKHLISLTGFTGTERERVKHMIKYTGASLTTYLTKHNTLLIATRPEGAKYNHAKKWGIPVVNIQWLTDVMLGNFSALNQMEHLKYQQFGSPANFCFDPVLVPNLMHAWKMPINISQESYERVKRSASPVQMPPKAKKIKLEQVTDENDNLENVPISGTHRVLFSRCTDVKELRKMVVQLGGSLAKSASDATHLVLSHLQRTTKLLHCMCVGAKIVSESWLRDSHAANVFLDEPSYAPDPKDFNAKYKCDFAATMSTRNRSKLFDGKCFFVTPSVFPSKRELTEIIRSCGGVVERTRRTMSQIEATNTNSPYSYIILTHEHDLHLVADLLKNKKDKIRIVCNVELVLSAVLRQTFEVEPYVVKVV